MGVGKVYEGGQVSGVATLLRTTVALGGGYKLTLGLTSERRMIGEYLPRRPVSWSPVALAKRVNAAASRLLIAAAARPGFLITNWHLVLPAASVSRSGGPLKRSRPSVARIVP